MDKVKYANLPKRKVSIPTVFQSYVHYKQIFKAALTGTFSTMLRKMLSFLNSVFLKLQKQGEREREPLCAFGFGYIYSNIFSLYPKLQRQTKGLVHFYSTM